LIFFVKLCDPASMLRKLIALLFLGCFITAAQTRPPAGIPRVMQVCAAVCATLNWANGRFEVLARDGIPAITYTVESFTPKSIILHRRELQNSPAYGMTAVYRGTFEDGSDTAHGSVDFTWPDHPGFPSSNHWTATGIEPAGFVFLDPGVRCSPAAFYGPASQATQRATLALEAKKNDTAACWLRIGANQGDADAEGMLAVLLYKGLSGPPDYPEAFSWAKKAADQGNYLGERCLSLMYASGQGVAKDAAQAQTWGAKAEQAKAALILAEQQAQEQRQQQMHQRQVQAQAQQSQQQFRDNMGRLLMLGLLFGSMDGEGSDTSSGSCTAGYWQNAGGMGQTWVCTAHGK
jgi:hypothetical protein